MTLTSRSRLFTAALALSLAAGSAAALAQNAAPNAVQSEAKAAPAKPAAAPAAAAAPARSTVLTLDADVTRILIDEKDANLKKALAMLPARVRELRNEIPDAESAPPELFDLAAWMLGKPVRVGIEYSQANTKGSRFGAGVVLSFGGTADEIAAADGLVKKLAATTGAPFQPSKADAGMSELNTPAGLLRIGTRDSANAGKRLEVQFGSVTSPDTIFKAVTPAGVAAGTKDKPFISGYLDLAPLTPLLGGLNMFLAANPNTADLLPGLQRMGLVGTEAVTFEFTSGHLADRAYATTRLAGYKKFAKEGGYDLPALTPAELKIIPADAHSGEISKASWIAIIEQFKAAIASDPRMSEDLDKVESHLGISITADLIDQIGTVSGYYMADSTGGGSLASLVIFLQVKDPAKMKATITRFASVVNKEVSKGELARGYIGVRESSVGAVTITGLRFPGLPIPLEPTLTVEGNFLLVGLTPQAAVAAADQVAGRGDGGITTNESISSLLPKGKELYKLNFVDARKTIPSGYGLMSMGGSALSNLVRSRADESGKLAKDAREPGLIMPTYSVLIRNARSQVTTTYFSGDDLLTEWQGDLSLLVNLTSSIGALTPLAPVVAAAAAAAGIAANEQRGGMSPFGGFGPGRGPGGPRGGDEPADDEPMEPMDDANPAAPAKPGDKPKF